VTPPTGITSGEMEIAEAIEEQIENAPPSPPIGVPAPPPPPPMPQPQTPATTPVPQPTQAAAGRSKRTLVIVAVVIAALLGAGAFVLLSGGDDGEVVADSTGTVTGATGVTGVTGTTGTTGTTGATGTLSLAEAQVFGVWNMTFSPEGDPSAGSATDATWELEANCEDRTGPHPCDVDAVSPMSGFLQRQGKSYFGTVTGDFLCGPSDMQMSFEVTKAAQVGGPWRATEVRGEGTMLSGVCQGSVFTFVGTLA
jgi:hypothetical protein